MSRTTIEFLGKVHIDERVPFADLVSGGGFPIIHPKLNPAANPDAGLLFPLRGFGDVELSRVCFHEVDTTAGLLESLRRQQGLVPADSIHFLTLFRELGEGLRVTHPNLLVELATTCTDGAGYPAVLCVDEVDFRGVPRRRLRLCDASGGWSPNTHILAMPIGSPGGPLRTAVMYAAP